MAMLLCCEKRLLNQRHGLGRDSTTGVVDQDCDVISDSIGFYRKDSTGGHCIPGVRGETQEQLFEVSLSRLDIRNGIAKLNVHLNTLSLQAISKDCERAVQGTAHIGLEVALAGISRQSQHSAEDSAAGL